mmetsp:Transcript_2975/g.6687  ORF Transcript_2975/g.6687 Transcript_2975/m.6687 type:complete len:217 (+) Transcript_2975:2049-2699(+)
MSVFRSLPDAWAIGQLFPIAPLHRLSEAPTIAGSLADLTCDSDGRVDHFVGPTAPQLPIGDRGQAATCLPLHPTRAGEAYLMAAFLVGAYQESMGSRHNLFGSTTVANVYVTGGPADRAMATLAAAVAEGGAQKKMKVTESTGGRARNGMRLELESVALTLEVGQTAADVLRESGAEPEELLEWVTGGGDFGGVVDNTELLARYERALRSCTYLES